MGATSQVEERSGPWIGVRHLIIFLVFLGTMVGYSMRVNLSIAIVDMTQDDCKDADCEKFSWSPQLRTVILSSFFWGYIVLQVPSALLAQKFGIKWLLMAGIALSSLGTVLTPIAASLLDWGGVCAARFVEGLAQGALYPSIHAALAAWIPPEERGLMASIAFSGSQIGTIITFPIGGFLASSVGWPSIFYLFGGLGFAWCVLWLFLASGSPRDHPFISDAEREYIEVKVAKKEAKEGSLRTPWMQLLKSSPMWAVLLAHCAQNWGFWILMTGIPTYMKDVLDQDIKSNGVLSAMPYLAMAVLSYVFGWIQDTLLRRRALSLAISRKTFNTIAFWGPAAALTALSFVTKDRIDVAVVLLVLAVGLNGGVYIGFQVNHIDLSPNFAGTMMGITNAVSNVFSIIGPLVVGVIGNGKNSSEQWKLVFWITSAVYFVGNLLFVVMGKADRQPWDDPDYGTKSVESAER